MTSKVKHAGSSSSAICRLMSGANASGKQDEQSSPSAVTRSASRSTRPQSDGTNLGEHFSILCEQKSIANRPL